MGKINLLDTQISNKIAAGEVVERPASVVKELVENSIDAGATRITVEIKNGGNTYIKVSDNGGGMEKDDALVAFLRHATSKISTASDLEAIYTLGFRGEALSSIGAVAMVDLYTKRAEDETGTHTICEGGEIVSSEDAGIPNGTTFIVKNLFYNVPARMKFLKKDATEAGYISDIMTRFILAHPEIAFTFISNNKTLLSSSGDGNLQNCVYSVYGKDYSQSMLAVNFNSENIYVKGLCGKGNTARPNRSYQSFFVNGRYVKSPLIMRAVEEAYKNQVMIGKFPVCVLNLEINPKLTDINVHPTKLEVKFSDENEVYRAVYNAVKEALYRVINIPQIVKKEEKKETHNFVRDNVTVKEQIEIKPQIEKKTVESVFVPEVKKVSTPQFFETVKKPIIEQPKVYAAKIEELKKTEVKKEPISQKEEIKEQKEFKLIGQIFDTYIIIECEDKMMIIDQHAAHERIKYEELKKAVENSLVYSQGLVVPVIANLTSVEMATYEQNIDFIKNLGFVSEKFDENSVIIREIPINSLKEDTEDLFIEIISQLDENRREIISEKKQRLLYTIACKAAIKANHKMSDIEQKELVNKVLELENINTCPHGRPIIVSMSQKEIEKEFKRIV